MLTKEEYKELSAKIRHGLELAERKMLEEFALRGESVCMSGPDGKIIHVPAAELLEQIKKNEEEQKKP